MWIREMPKVELHCHLDGSIPAQVLRKLCREEQIEIPEDEKEFEKLIQVEENCGSLAEYLSAFDIPLRCLRTEQAFFEAAYETARAASQENVRYLELRFAPLSCEHEKLSAESMIEAAIAGFERARKETGIEGALILCGMRHFREEQNRRTLALGKRYLHRGVCGIDLAGDEASFPNAQFAEYFKRAAKMEIPFTIHAGECGSKENIRAALDFGACRIGHGTAMAKDPGLQEEVADKGIGVELCPSSNVQTKAVTGWEAYPFAEFLKSGMMLSINTDNRTVTGTTMTRELELLEKRFGLVWQDAGKLMKNAIETSFAEESVKRSIKKEIEEWERSAR